MMRSAVLASLALATAAAAPTDRPDEAVTRWARTAAVSIDDDARLLRAIGPARLLALGEWAHGVREPLILRNRLIRALGGRGELDLVMLESGFVEGRRLNAYVMGGPGDAQSVARHNLNWGFGRYPENVELLRWLRAHNATPGVRRIAVHGVDLPGGNSYAIGDAAIATVDAQAFLRRAAPGRDEGLIAALEPFARDLSLTRWFKMPPAAQAALLQLADRLVAFHLRHRAALVAASSPDDAAWEERSALVLRQVLGVFAAWPADNQAGDSPRGMYPVVEARDAAMAANTLWLMGRTPARARALLFMHNGHVGASPRFDPPPHGYPRQYTVIGVRLRAALGPAMTVVLTNVARAAPSAKGAPNPLGSFGAALGAVAPSPFMVDLRRAPGALELDRAWIMGTNMLPEPGAQGAPRRAADLVVSYPAGTDVATLP